LKKILQENVSKGKINLGTIYIKRAKELLLRTYEAPQMFASTREAMLAHICGIVSVVDKKFSPRVFYIKHAGTYGNTYCNMQGEVETEWARKTITAALSRLDKRGGRLKLEP
jgi:hypothetical protein